VTDLLLANTGPFRSGDTAQKVCRVLYYGPANAGKRDNLRGIYRAVPPEQRLSLAGDDPERQIAFQVSQGPGEHWQVLVQATDCGQERSRRGGMSPEPPFDGIVFVVSSAAAELDEGLAALEHLKRYLEDWSLDLMTVPVVIQYNNRHTEGVLPVNRLEDLLNPWGLLSFPAQADAGEGVRETLKAVLGLTVTHLASKTPAATSPTTQPPEVSAEQDSGLGLDYGPPIPGVRVCESTRVLSDAIYDELRVPIVIPVKIPKRLVTGADSIRILLEVEIVDGDD